MSLTPTQKANFRKWLPNYCARAEAAQLVWHYSAQRPEPVPNTGPEEQHVADCGKYVQFGYSWTMHKTGVYVPDPMGENYGPYGNTGTMEAWLRQHGKQVTTQPYLVGDIALFGPNGHADTPDSHTIVCTVRGSAAASQWSSNGTEAAPNRCTLASHELNPLVGVWRHPALL